MKVEKHGDHLWRLTRLFFFNCYLVAEDDGLTLIDTGLSGSAQGIQEAIARSGMSLARITLTHAHTDHVGSLDELTALFPQAEVSFAARTDAFLQGDLALLPEEPQAALRGGFVRSTSRPTRTLSPGDYLGSLRVLAAPGHSPDQIAFLDARDGTLIAGDAFQTQAGTAVSGVLRWLFPFPAMATWHLPTALQSARTLRRLEPTQLAVGHGPVLAHPLAEMDKAIEEAEEKLHDEA